MLASEKGNFLQYFTSKNWRQETIIGQKSVSENGYSPSFDGTQSKPNPLV